MTGRKAWVSDEVLSAADLNNYLMDQAVTIWANASARNSGILSPINGQISYLQDTSKFQAYNGSAWVDQASLGGTAVYATSAGTAVYATNAGTATRLNGITIFNSSSTPTANAAGDLWFY
jgi:hypothetical protein